MLLPLIFAFAQLLADTATTSAGAQDPAWGTGGRLAVGIRGDLWIRSSPEGTARWMRITQGPQWDRSPAWSADGAMLVFTSTATGVPQLWRVTVGVAGAASAPERVTTSRDVESEPALSGDGSMAFVRGRGPLARIWLRRPDGSERRLTKRESGAERWPAWSPDGARLVYSTVSEGRTRLRLHMIAGDSSRVVVEDRDAERASWSPDGRITFATRSGRAGVWITTPDARYVNLVSGRRAAPAWSLDGRSLALVELPPADPGYNGDPDRLGDRELRDAKARTLFAQPFVFGPDTIPFTTVMEGG